MVKGKARPVEAVTRRAGHRDVSASGTASGLPFVGRDAELDVLAARRRDRRAAATGSSSRSSARPASASPDSSTRCGAGSVG